VGVTGSLKPKNGPKTSFEITVFDPEREFTNVSNMPGARVTFRHVVESNAGITNLAVTVEVAGPLGWLWRRIIGPGLAASAQEGLDTLVAQGESQTI
jgi:hypothetical protein